MNKILNILSWLFLLVGMGFLMGFSSEKRKSQPYSSLDISIQQPTHSRFITKENIEIMFNNLGYGSDGQPLSDVDIRQFETLLGNKPSIASANVHKTIAGKVVVQISEREPIVRIYNRFGESFYLDKTGSLMPLSNQYSARVLIANGDINIPYSTVYVLEDLEKRINRIYRKSNTSAVQNTSLIKKLKVDQEELPGALQLKDLFQIAQFINNDPFWAAQISQVFVNDKNDFELIPRVGGHTILFGSGKDIKTKFNKLMTFYEKGLSKTGWNEYTIINLKYKNQVVCTKR